MTELEKGIVCVTAPNPSPLTYKGTNSYVVGEERVVVIDPVPIIGSHFDALVDAVGPRPVDAVIVTHSHKDHSPLSFRLAQQFGVPVLGFGPSDAGRSEVMETLVGQIGGGEGIDTDFTPDRCVVDGEEVFGLTVVHTPGHMGNHICLEYGDVLFSGDHVMGWATSLVSPPDGDLTDFMTSCRKLRSRPSRRYFPGHGDPIEMPMERLDWLIAHRLDREEQILSALSQGPADTKALTRAVYQDVAEHLWPAAERNVIAHLIDLVGQNKVAPSGKLSVHAQFHRL